MDKLQLPDLGMLVYRHSRCLSAIILLGRCRNRAYEVALHRELVLLSNDDSNKSSSCKSCLQLSNLPWTMAQQVSFKGVIERTRLTLTKLLLFDRHQHH